MLGLMAVVATVLLSACSPDDSSASSQATVPTPSAGSTTEAHASAASASEAHASNVQRRQEIRAAVRKALGGDRTVADVTAGLGQQLKIYVNDTIPNVDVSGICQRAKSQVGGIWTITIQEKYGAGNSIQC